MTPVWRCSGHRSRYLSLVLAPFLASCSALFLAPFLALCLAPFSNVRTVLGIVLGIVRGIVPGAILGTVLYTFRYSWHRSWHHSRYGSWHCSWRHPWHCFWHLSLIPAPFLASFSVPFLAWLRRFRELFLTGFKAMQRHMREIEALIWPMFPSSDNRMATQVTHTIMGCYDISSPINNGMYIFHPFITVCIYPCPPLCLAVSFVK